MTTIIYYLLSSIIQLPSLDCLPGPWTSSRCRSTMLIPHTGVTGERRHNSASFMRMAVIVLILSPSKPTSPVPCRSPGMAAISASTWNNAAFSKSKALLGSICDVERSRVSELQNPDPERSLAPHWRAPRFKSPTVS